jgi:hypothetical protein
MPCGPARGAHAGGSAQVPAGGADSGGVEHQEHQDQGHYVKRVVLPSGKTIEVVYFDRTDVAGETGPEAEQVSQQGAITRELHLCEDCDSDLVYPVEWQEHGRQDWKIMRRCPNCEWTDTSVFPQDLVDAFDEVLDTGTEALTKDLKRLMRANMADEIDLFVQALEADAILPEDF